MGSGESKEGYFTHHVPDGSPTQSEGQYMYCD